MDGKLHPKFWPHPLFGYKKIEREICSITNAIRGSAIKCRSIAMTSNSSSERSRSVATYLAEIAAQEELTLDTPVNRSIRQSIETLKSDQFAKVAAETFATIERTIDSIVDGCKNSRSIQVLSQSAQPKIFNFRAFQLTSYLDSVAGKHPSCPTNPFVWQQLVDKSYLSLLTSIEKTLAKPATASRSLTLVEMNAVRYAAGFIVRKLLKKCNDDGRTKYVECLQGMIHNEDEPQLANGVEADNFEDYTSVWLRQTDRGSLCHVNDVTFWLFSEVEILIFDKLQRCMREEHSVASIVAFTTEDDDIQYIWSSIESDKLPAEESKKLLDLLIEEWVRLQGHSLCSEMMEAFKQSSAEKEKGKRSLCKELKRAHEYCVATVISHCIDCNHIVHDCR